MKVKCQDEDDHLDNLFLSGEVFFGLSPPPKPHPKHREEKKGNRKHRGKGAGE